jgi:chemotaxis protein CheZ
MTGELSGPIRAARLAIVRRLLEAIENGDADGERRIFEALGRSQFHELYRELDRIAAEMNAVLSNVPVTNELSRLAHRELPAAPLRLNQVLELTEEAAHQTLTAVEYALPLAKRMETAATDLLDGGSDGSGRQALVRAVLETIAADAKLLKDRLSDVMVAQSYQDLTGQIMRPVARLVTQLAATLTESTEMASHDSAAVSTAGKKVNDQQEVDDLMSTLGL